MLQQQINKMGENHVEVLQKECAKKLALLWQHIDRAKKMSADCDKWTGDTYKAEVAKWVAIAVCVKDTATAIGDDFKSLKDVHNEAVLATTTETRTTACRVRLITKINPLQGQGVPATVVTWIGEAVLGIKGAQGEVQPQQSAASAHFLIDPSMDTG